MKDPQLSGIAKALAAHGRKGDTELIHVSKKELDMLEKYGAGLGIHLTKNPQTGLPEAFNWGGMLGSVALPILLTVATGGTAAPLALAAAGAAGGFGGTMLGGGSTDQALMSGVMGGIGGFGMGGVAEGLAAAGTTATEQATAAAIEGAATDAGSNLVADTAAQQGTQSIMGNVGTNAAYSNLGQAATPTASNILSPTYGLGSNIAAGQAINPAASQALGTSMGVTADVAKNAAASAAGTSTNPLISGAQNIFSSPDTAGSFLMNNAKNIGMAGIGALGAGASLNPQEQTIQTESTDSGSRYEGEMYMEPETGVWRTRAVRKAAEGGPMFSDYDAADVAKDGGYAPGGYLNLAGGGEAGLASIGKGVPAVDNPDAVYPDYWLEASRLGPTRRQDGLAAGGGIGDLGSYSDGGRLLRGPGDGVSDNIPATIENKRPARLADGEFVIPARAVSELGNGSTEAGSKQLYKMLDRIAQKRKSGKGLAYEANPKKLMPV